MSGVPRCVLLLVIMIHVCSAVRGDISKRASHSTILVYRQWIQNVQAASAAQASKIRELTEKADRQQKRADRLWQKAENRQPALILKLESRIGEVEGQLLNQAQLLRQCSYKPQPVVLENGLTLQYDDNDGGNWVIFQRRKGVERLIYETVTDVSFNRKWAEYTHGFGNDDVFWLGLGYIYGYCNMKTPCELRVDIQTSKKTAYAKYSTFGLRGPEENYAIALSGYSGTAGESMKDLSNKRQEFVTRDRDNDSNPLGNCAFWANGGGWWLNKCNKANLNGAWFDKTTYWSTFNGTPVVGNHSSLTNINFTEMKMRRKNVPLDNGPEPELFFLNN